MNLVQINSKSCSDDRDQNYEMMCWLTYVKSLRMRYLQIIQKSEDILIKTK